MLKNSDILIFDDATSALDLKTEANLYAALRENCPDTTKIIIAQRIVSVRDADKIVVMDKGRVVEIGNHEELLSQKGRYYELYITQFAGNQT